MNNMTLYVSRKRVPQTILFVIVFQLYLKSDLLIIIF